MTGLPRRLGVDNGAEFHSNDFVAACRDFGIRVENRPSEEGAQLMQRFLAEHRSTFNRATGTERTPVLSLQMVNRPNEKRFYSQLMDVIGAPPNPRPSVADLEIVVLRMLRQLDLKMLLIDETHNILASTYNDQRAMLKSVAVHQQ